MINMRSLILVVNGGTRALSRAGPRPGRDRNGGGAGAGSTPPATDPTAGLTDGRSRVRGPCRCGTRHDEARLIRIHGQDARPLIRSGDRWPIGLPATASRRPTPRRPRPCTHQMCGRSDQQVMLETNSARGKGCHAYPVKWTVHPGRQSGDDDANRMRSHGSERQQTGRRQTTHGSCPRPHEAPTPEPFRTTRARGGVRG
jgi:hypothetical protein